MLFANLPHGQLCLHVLHRPYWEGIPGGAQRPVSPTDGSASLLLPSRPAPPRQAPYLVPIELWDWGQPVLSSTATVTVSVCRCRPDGSVASCRPEAQLSPAGLSTGALLAIVTCVGTLLGESSHRWAHRCEVQACRGCGEKQDLDIGKCIPGRERTVMTGFSHCPIPPKKHSDLLSLICQAKDSHEP